MPRYGNTAFAFDGSDFGFPEPNASTWTERWHDIVEHVAISPDMDSREALLDDFSRGHGVRTLGFVNAHAMNSVASDPEFAADLLDLDYLVRDGVGVQALYRIIGSHAGLNLNGTDLLPPLIERFAGKRVAVFGTRLALAGRVGKQLRAEHGCDVIFADGFRHDGYYVEAVARHRTDLVVLGMGMPKQERVARLMKAALRQDTGIVCGGAIIDFLSGHVPRAPVWMRRSGTEWMFRLSLEPRRLFRRYVIGNPLFLLRSAILARRARKAGQAAPVAEAQPVPPPVPFGIGGPVPASTASRLAPGESARIIPFEPLPRPAPPAAVSTPVAVPLAAVPRAMASVFAASRPVVDRDDLYGRSGDLDRLRARVLESGGSALIYGPRGYGKTSLVRVFGEVADSLGHLVIYASCSRGVDFDALIRPYLDELDAETGGTPAPRDVPLTVQSVAMRLAASPGRSLVFIMDEFDRIERDDTRENVVELIKDVSDLTSAVRFLLVGVATDAAHILGYHPSIHRCLSCVPLGRLAADDITVLFNEKAAADRLRVDPSVVAAVVELVGGSAYHTQLIGEKLVAQARRAGRDTVGPVHLAEIVGDVVEDATRIDPALAALAGEFAAVPALRELLPLVARAALADREDMVRFIAGSYGGKTITAEQFEEFCQWLVSMGVLTPGPGRFTSYRFVNAFTPQLVLMLQYVAERRLTVRFT